MPSIKTSVIIPTYNRAPFLKTCLLSLETQIYDKQDFEVIVIDDGSTDATAELLREFKDRTTLNFSFISHPNSGVSFSRNVGIQASKARYIVFTDDDCILVPDWLSKMHHFFSLQDDSIAGIGGPLNSVTKDRTSYAARFIEYIDEFNYIPVFGKYFIRVVHVSRLTGQEQIPYVRTSNAMFRANCLKEVGGFDISFRRPGGEDPDVCYRLLNLNYHFRVYKDLAVNHQCRESIGSYFKSLKNYLEGEIKKSRKKYLYNNGVIQRTYSFIPVQKIISFLLAAFLYPWQFYKLALKQYTFYQKISFPLLIVVSKAYAILFSCYFYFKYFNRKTSTL